MSKFVIIVEFNLEDGSFERFHAAVLENAERSLNLEPGCQRFDVLIPEGEKNRVVLYEIYEDVEAFEAHRKMPHFQEFDTDVQSCVRGRSLSRFLLSNAS